MDSYGSCSLRKRTSRTILSLISAALTVALFSTTATAVMFYSGHGPARQRVLREYDSCSAQSNLRSDENKVFTECIDRGIAGMTGLCYGALVHAEGSTGYAWNFRPRCQVKKVYRTAGSSEGR